MKRWMTIPFVFMTVAVCSWVFAETPDSGWDPTATLRNEDFPRTCEPAPPKPCEPVKAACCACCHEVKPPDWNPVLWLNRLICREVATSSDSATPPPWNPAWLPGRNYDSMMCKKMVRVKKLPLPCGGAEQPRTLFFRKMMM